MNNLSLLWLFEGNLFKNFPRINIEYSGKEWFIFTHVGKSFLLFTILYWYLFRCASWDCPAVFFCKRTEDEKKRNLWIYMAINPIVQLYQMLEFRRPHENPIQGKTPCFLTPHCMIKSLIFQRFLCFVFVLC